MCDADLQNPWVDPDFDTIQRLGCFRGLRILVYGNHIAVVPGQYMDHARMRQKLGIAFSDDYVVFLQHDLWKCRKANSTVALIASSLPEALRCLINDLDSTLHLIPHYA